MAVEPLTLDTVRTRLGAYEPRALPMDAFRPAAVLIPLVARPSGLEVVLTMRPGHLSSHARQVAFPGGGADAEDADRWSTATREAREELAIPAEALEPLGRLDDYRSISRYHITPWVALLDPETRLRPCPYEVEEAFSVPLSHFRDPSRRRTMMAGSLASGRPEDAGERIIFYLTRPHVTWGVTAAIVSNLLSVVDAAVSR